MLTRSLSLRSPLSLLASPWGLVVASMVLAAAVSQCGYLPDQERGDQARGPAALRPGAESEGIMTETAGKLFDADSFRAWYKAMPKSWQTGLWEAILGGAWLGELPENTATGTPKVVVFFVHADLAGRVVEALEEPTADVCEHGVPVGDWCPPCNQSYRQAAKEAGDDRG